MAGHALWRSRVLARDIAWLQGALARVTTLLTAQAVESREAVGLNQRSDEGIVVALERVLYCHHRLQHLGCDSKRNQKQKFQGSLFFRIVPGTERAAAIGVGPQ